MKWMLLMLMLAIGPLSAVVQGAEPMICGADVSGLPDMETAGAVYRDGNQPADALQIMRRAGCNLFRVRLFVDPEPDRTRAHGATQDLKSVIALAKRIRATRAKFMLDFHYSDTWADPLHQATPRAWKDLTLEQLEEKLTAYTRETLVALHDAGVDPDEVQIGNEITSGLLWPVGKVPDAKDPAFEQQWDHVGRLLAAASKGVRAAQKPEHPIRIILHIHGGGRKDVPTWFFSHLQRYKIDYDTIGLSFYPIWKDSLPVLDENLRALVKMTGKDILICEVSYPWRPVQGKSTPQETWPTTPEGQALFCADLYKTLNAIPDHKARGAIWWFPESSGQKGLGVYHWGSEALFDDQGNPTPGMKAFFSP